MANDYEGIFDMGWFYNQAIDAVEQSKKNKEEEEGFDWGDLLSKGLDAGEIILALMTANQASKGTLKEDWKAANPSYNNPFGSITSDWNGGNPIINHELSPEVQGIVDSLIIDQLQTERIPYGMPNAMRDIYDSNLNWQRERYGLDPVENASGQPDSFTGGSEPTDDLTGGDTEPDYKPKYKQRDYDDIGTRLGDTYKDAGLRGGDSTTYDEFKLRDQYADGYNRYMDGSNNGFGYNGYGKPWGNSSRGASSIADAFPSNDQLPIGSLDQLEDFERYGDLGKLIGRLGGVATGNPILSALLSKGGEWLGNAYGDSRIGDYTWMSPWEDPEPQPSGNELINEAFGVRDENLPMSPARWNIPVDYNSMRGGRNNSITGNGAYGYATRLRPRGGYYDDPRTRQPLPDKIGES